MSHEAAFPVAPNSPRMSRRVTLLSKGQLPDLQVLRHQVARTEGRLKEGWILHEASTE